ncbi:hypothetical protein ACLMJK_006592 [Lecanora helva]
MAYRSGCSPSAPVTPEASTSATGFFQTTPKVQNQFYEDVALQRAFSLFLPKPAQASLVSDLSTFGAAVLESKVLGWTADAESHPPRLETWDIWGRRQDRLITSEGWRNLQSLGIAQGMVAIAYENKFAEYRRLYQFFKYHLWTGSCAYVTCPSAMTDGAARLLSRHTRQDQSHSVETTVFEAALSHLISRNSDEAWTSGQWMTERVGGSDVRNTETLATYSPIPEGSESERQSTSTDGQPLGPWAINGFKWFSSATDAEMAILLARTPEGGLSAFYAPMRRTVPQKTEMEDSSLATTELNGIHIQRLKTKLGTKALPTAELSLNNTRAYLLGEQGHGVQEISTILNITRVHNAVTACGLLGRGLAISRAFARVRSVQGKLLMDTPAHVSTMAKIHVEYRAFTILTFFVVALLGVAETPSNSQISPAYYGSIGSSTPVPRNTKVASRLLRILTPVVKALTAKTAIAGLAECMESLGGVGYLDSSSPVDIETNIARLYRDANVLSIWEGTTDVMSDDAIRVLKGKGGAEVLAELDSWIKRNASNEPEYDILRSSWTGWLGTVKSQEIERLRTHGREVINELAWIVSAILLMEDARTDGDMTASQVASRWVQRKTRSSTSEALDVEDWEKRVKWDREIVFGDSEKLQAKL